MYGYEATQGERTMSRSDRILEAKSAFAQREGRNTRGYTRGNDFSGTYSVPKETLPREEGKHHFGMLRMVIAGMLFFVLVTAFHFQVSYYGFNKESVQELLADESHWNSLVNQVVQVMNTIQK